MRKFLIVVSPVRRLSFMSMYEQGYVLVWADTVEDVIGLVQRGQPVDAILLDGVDEHEVEDLRKNLSLSCGSIRIGVVAAEDRLISPDSRADFLIRDSGSPQELADTLDRVLRSIPESARHS